MKKLLSFMILLLIFLSGCSKEIIKEVPVPVPVKCQVKYPQPPITDTPNAEYLKSILIYTELVKSRLYFCIYGENLKSVDDENKK